MTLYHGGPAGIDRILPPEQTGALSQSLFGNGVCRTDRVYLTPSFRDASFFALYAPCEGAVAVYECVPVGKLEVDPDAATPGHSFACPEASVLRVVAHLDEGERRAMLARSRADDLAIVAAVNKRERKRAARLAQRAGAR